MATILLVDDNPVDRELLRVILGPSGHKILEASDAVVALELAASERPDLLISDIVMPTMDGYGLARELRSNQATKDTRLMFYTATATATESGVRKLAEASGAMGIIPKPSEPQQVIALVNAALLGEPRSIAPTEVFDREHLKLVNDRLFAKVQELDGANRRLDRLRDELVVREEHAARLAAIVESSQDAIVGVDLDGAITSWNVGAQQLFGYSATEVLGLPAWFLSTEDTVDESTSNRERLMGGELIPVYRTKRRRKDGTLVHVSLAASPVLDRAGALRGASLIFRDMTEYERAEHALKLGLEQEREMVAQLQELDRVKQSFLASVSHELRTPLTTILGYLELILGDMVPTDLDPDVRQMLDAIDVSAKRLFALIEDLLVRARIDSGSYRVVKVPVEVATVINNVRRVLDSTAEASSVDLVFDCHDTDAIVLGDRMQLERVLLNLIGNAIKFTPGGGKVEVGVVRAEDAVRLVVCDTGIGIPDKDREQIFSPFFRSAEADRKAIQGTGLGLSIAKEIVEHLSGSIWCESVVGSGTTMTVSLPVASRKTTMAD